MHTSLISLELLVIGLGLVLMLADAFVPADRRRWIGYVAVGALAILFAETFGTGSVGSLGTAFGGAFVNDALAIFFKRLFILAAILVLLIAVEFADRIAAAAEYYSLIVFALAGMLFAASSNDFAMLFVSIELITITFYVLVSFQRSRVVSLEAGVKYLILGGLSSAFMIYGIALIWGTTGKLNFTELAAVAPPVCAEQGLFAGRRADAGGHWLQDRGVSLPNLGAGRLPGRADAHDGVPGHWFQSGWICPAFAGAVYRPARGDQHDRLGEFPDHYLGPDHSVRQPLRHPATQH